MISQVNIDNKSFEFEYRGFIIKYVEYKTKRTFMDVSEQIREFKLFKESELVGKHLTMEGAIEYVDSFHLENFVSFDAYYYDKKSNDTEKLVTVVSMDIDGGHCWIKEEPFGALKRVKNNFMYSNTAFNNEVFEQMKTNLHQCKKYYESIEKEKSNIDKLADTLKNMTTWTQGA